MIKTVRALCAIRRMTGRTQSILMRCDDKELYVVKFKNNPDGIDAIANEVIVTKLARYLSIPVPDIAFVNVSSELIDHNQQLCLNIPVKGYREGIPDEIRPTFVPCEAGLQFGSRYSNSGPWQIIDFLPQNMNARIDNLDDFAAALILDLWTGSREPRQTLFIRDTQAQSFKALFIDHHQSIPLDREAQFDNSDLALDPYSMVHNVKSRSCFEPSLCLVEAVNRHVIDDLIGELPSEWNRGAEWRERTSDYLYTRSKLVRGWFQRCPISMRGPRREMFFHCLTK